MRSLPTPAPTDAVGRLMWDIYVVALGGIDYLDGSVGATCGEPECKAAADGAESALQRIRDWARGFVTACPT